MSTRETSTECKSYDGINTGLIDSILTNATLLKIRLRDSDWDINAVKEALIDLSCDEDLSWLIKLAKDLRT